MNTAHEAAAQVCPAADVALFTIGEGGLAVVLRQDDDGSFSLPSMALDEYEPIGDAAA